jgi:hypothetical protein
MMERMLSWIAPHTMLLVGLVFVVLGSVFTTIGTVRSMLSRAEENRRIHEQTKMLNSQTSRLQVLNERIDLKSDEIQKQTVQLEQLNQQISRRSEEIVANTQALQAASERLLAGTKSIQTATLETFRRYTGGLSFAIVRPSTELLNTNALALKLAQSGEYALYDVYLIIRDEDRSSEMSLLAAGGFDEFLRAVEHHETHDILRPGFEESLQFAPRLPDGADKQFYIRMFARNGMVLERLRVIRKGGRLEYALKAWRYLRNLAGGDSEKEDVVNEQSSPGFPRDSAGQIIWRYVQR